MHLRDLVVEALRDLRTGADPAAIRARFMASDKIKIWWLGMMPIGIHVARINGDRYSAWAGA